MINKNSLALESDIYLLCAADACKLGLGETNHCYPREAWIVPICYTSHPIYLLNNAWPLIIY